MSFEHPVYEIVQTTLGVTSIRHKGVNEIMHNPVGPWTEANALYVEPSRIEEKLMCNDQPELILFDVGLGAAANALAVLDCAREIATFKTPRRLRIISFERDLELLRFALAHADTFPHFRGFEDAIATLLETGLWSNEFVTWELRHGDFREKIEIEPFKPHLIYFDPYSSKQNREMWSTDCFRQIRKRCRTEDEGGTILYTYSQATPIRFSLLNAGFFVGVGPASGPKEETTQAASVLSDLIQPLDSKWLNRWERSHTKFPFGTKPEDELPLRDWLIKHPQFLVEALQS